MVEILSWQNGGPIVFGELVLRKHMKAEPCGSPTSLGGAARNRGSPAHPFSEHDQVPVSLRLGRNSALGRVEMGHRSFVI